MPVKSNVTVPDGSNLVSSINYSKDYIVLGHSAAILVHNKLNNSINKSYSLSLLFA
jgi:hypothetical protein